MSEGTRWGAGIRAVEVLALLFSILIGQPPAAALGQEGGLPPEATEALKKSAGWNAYRVKFWLEAVGDEEEPFRLEGTLLFAKPSFRRLELRERGSEQQAQLLVADGKTEWQHYPETGVVYRLQDPPEAPGPHRPFSEVEPGTLRFVERMEKGGENLLRFEGKPVPAMVEDAPVPVRTLRVDLGESDGLAREMTLLGAEGQPVLTQRFSDFELNPTIPEGTFAFVPSEEMAVVDLGAERGQPTPEGATE